MKILVVSEYFWPEGFRFNEIVTFLVERDVEVDFLSSDCFKPSKIS